MAAGDGSRIRLEGDGVRLNRFSRTGKADNSCTDAFGREQCRPMSMKPASRKAAGFFYLEPGMNKTLLMCVGIGVLGAAGSLARFGVAEACRLATAFPAGTLAVNVAGAFALGWVNATFKDPGYDVWRIVLGVGLLGGFTTFSSMMADADNMMTDAQYLRTAGYLGASLFLGLVAVRAGVIVGKGM